MKSARILGEENGLTSQEMNYILKKEGFLTGEAGEYAVTDKGAPFAEEKDYHRGTGGYGLYNKYWTTRTWDESIENELNITDDMKEEARSAVAEARRQQWADIKTARATADSAFLERYNQNNIDSSGDNDNENLYDYSSESNSVFLKIGGLALLAFTMYKVAPHAVKLWRGSVAPKLSGIKKTLGNKVFNKMICPSCGSKMKINDGTAIWKCKKCDCSISE